MTSAGIATDQPSYGASVEMRYFGPRVLDQGGDAVSTPSTLVDVQLVAKFKHGTQLRFDIFNLLNSVSDDVTYYYQSWLPHDATMPGNAALDPSLVGGGVNDDHFHPSDSRQVRATYSVRF